jgi:hypothetical protein
MSPVQTASIWFSQRPTAWSLSGRAPRPHSAGPRIVLAIVSASLGLLALDAPAVPCDVLLNEILSGPARDWNGDGTVSSRDDEWVEIVNLGSAPADLSGYLLSDGDSTVRFAYSGSLAAGGHRLVFGLEAVEWQRANARSVTGLSLNNSGDSVRLWRIIGPDTTLVDAYAYKTHESTGDRASARRPDGGAWALFDGLNPYSGVLEPTGTGCVPTPGAANECPVTETKASTWGRVKAAYR